MMTRGTLFIATGIVAGFLVSFLAGLAVGYRLGQPNFRISPPDTAKLLAEGHHVTINYGRPYMRQREIFGALVPYGEVWRTGADEATTLVTDADLLLADVPVPAGEYTLFTIPRRAAWTLIVNRQAGQWGTVYDPRQDLVRVEMETERLDEPVEQFTIRFEARSETDGWLLVIEWETTRASVPLTVPPRRDQGH